MALQDLITKYRERESQPDLLKSKWYTVAAAALAAAGAGPDVPELYLAIVAGLDVKDEKVVQCRLKEAILKTSCLYGVPRSLQALLPLFAILKDEVIDHSGPRYKSLGSKEAEEQRVEKGRRYFDTIWTPAAAQANRDRNFKFQPDLYLLNLKMIYEWHFAEDAILSNVETQMCNTAALICSNCPVQAMWHCRGIVRLGGSMEDAHFAQDLGLAIADLYGCKTGVITPVDEINFKDTTPH